MQYRHWRWAQRKLHHQYWRVVQDHTHISVPPAGDESCNHCVLLTFSPIGHYPGCLTLITTWRRDCFMNCLECNRDVEDDQRSDMGSHVAFLPYMVHHGYLVRVHPHQIRLIASCLHLLAFLIILLTSGEAVCHQDSVRTLASSTCLPATRASGGRTTTSNSEGLAQFSPRGLRHLFSAGLQWMKQSNPNAMEMYTLHMREFLFYVI